MSDEKKQELHQRLYAESEEMMYKFQELFSSTTDSLQRSNIPVRELARHLECLGQLKPTFDDSGEPVFRHQLPELRKSESVDDAMSVVNKYCSFFNYRLVAHIIQKLGTEQDKEKLAKYEEDFAKYGERHVFECPSEVGESYEGQANMLVTLDDSFDKCNVNHLSAFVSNLQNVLNISNVTLRLCYIKPGSIKLIFQILHSVQQAIFPLSSEQEAELSSVGVVQLSCGDYQFTIPSETELHIASERGDLKKVKEVTEKWRFDRLEKEGIFGRNALHCAAWGGQLRVLRYFIEEKGCNPASQDIRGATPLHYAAAGKHLDIVRYLVAEQQMDPLSCAHNGTTPLHLASQAGDINVVRYLVNELSKFLPLRNIVTSRGIGGANPIHFAALKGHLQLVEYFITDLKCDPNIALPVQYQGRTTGVGGRIALHSAAQGGHLHIIKYLVEQCKCNPSHLDSERVTPLHLAAQCGHLEVVQYLTLKQHCDPLCIATDNNTPLHDASRCGHLKLVKFFVEVLHCPPNIRGQHNGTPRKMARSHGHHHVVEYLKVHSS